MKLKGSTGSFPPWREERRIEERTFISITPRERLRLKEIPKGLNENQRRYEGSKWAWAENESSQELKILNLFPQGPMNPGEKNHPAAEAGSAFCAAAFSVQAGLLEKA